MGCGVTTITFHLVLLCATDGKHGVERATVARDAWTWSVAKSSILIPFVDPFVTGPGSDIEDSEDLEETLYGVLDVRESQ